MGSGCHAEQVIKIYRLWLRRLREVENQKLFVLHLNSFHLYLIINKNTEKGIYLVIQERFSSNI